MQEEHELERCASGLVANGAPRHWRLQAAERGHGAFHGLRARALHLQLPKLHLELQAMCVRGVKSLLPIAFFYTAPSELFG